MEEEPKTKTLSTLERDGKDSENTKEKSCGSCNWINVESQHWKKQGQHRMSVIANTNTNEDHDQGKM